MIVIANKRVPENKRVSIALTYVYGIGNGIAKKILKDVGVDDKKVFELTSNESNDIIKEAEKYLIEDKLREKIYKDRSEKINLGTYQGRRLEQGLPVHGQSTRHNSRTAKRSRGVTASLSKAFGVKKAKKNIITKKKIKK